MKNPKKTSKQQQEIQSEGSGRLSIQCIQTLENEMKQLREREHKLAERLVAEHLLVNELRKNPHFIDDSDRTCLAALVDDVYNGFTTRLKTRFPNLTEVDLQYCVLIKLRFTVPQIAVLSAISPTSVYQQKSRMKKRILAVDSCLFGEGETLDSWLYEL